jgi:hypothetical protein
MNKYTITLISFFLLRVFYNPTVDTLIEYFYLKISRRVSGVSYIIIGQ